MPRSLVRFVAPLLVLALLGAGLVTKRPCCCSTPVAASHDGSTASDSTASDEAPRSCCASAGAKRMPAEHDGGPASSSPHCRCDHGRVVAVAPGPRIALPDAVAGLPPLATVLVHRPVLPPLVAVAATERGSPPPLWLSLGALRL